MPTSRYFDSGLPRVFAHRGFSLNVPENTIASFAAAVALGVSHIETDVHSSEDGIAVISHDPVLDRVASRAGNVSQFSYEQLKKIDLGGGQGFVSLFDALTEFPEIFFNIDVKSADAVEPTAQAIIAAGATDRVLVSSFSESRRSRTVRLLPGVATSASGRIFAVAVLAARPGITPLLRATLAGIDAVQIPETALGISTTTSAMVNRFHGAGVEVHVWTINDADDMIRLLDAGVDGIVTDRADIALDVVRRRTAEFHDPRGRAPGTI